MRKASLLEVTIGFTNKDGVIKSNENNLALLIP